ncbi:nucleoporin, putative (macronuclear) [Tetrahymena thermophila SB210]|uniref:Nucleoporin, putative n=2 Tax=Tetrahymena thermophila TaxID=5911 RepID=I7M1H1_TETTS|nr:nucleoporin, putative [Tetrahymena thermophila SB210]EAR96337.3 nucleoporin, putative [Tetrahymena thermophila SB210]BAI77726.1 nucleoporin Nup54 [Tetrahymena thermophila]|eukprot:XP_001016582.3 nucleoporin, putative [Tetrahymena thermophila SB210]
MFPQTNIFGGNQGATGGGLFNNNQGGAMNQGMQQGGLFTQQQTGLNNTFGVQPQQQQPQLGYFNQMQTINPNPQMTGFNQAEKNKQDVFLVLKHHRFIMDYQKNYHRLLTLIQDVCQKTNQNLVQETQKLGEGKVTTNNPNTTIQGIANPANNNQQQVVVKGINTENIEQTSQNLEKIREKNELIFAKLFEIHCLIERIASNANTIERDSNAEMRLFRQFNDIDSSITHQNQKLIDLNQKIIDAKNNQAGGELNTNNNQNSSAREQNGSINNQNITKKKQVLIDMLGQIKKGVEIIKEQHQEDSKDFEILIKKLNQSRTHPF